MADDAMFLPGLSHVAGKPVQVTFDAGRLSLLEHDAGQAASPARAGVDANASGADCGLGLHRVAMEHDLTEIAWRAEKRLPDQDQIFSLLLIGLYGRADGGRTATASSAPPAID